MHKLAKHLDQTEDERLESLDSDILTYRMLVTICTVALTFLVINTVGTVPVESSPEFLFADWLITTLRSSLMMLLAGGIVYLALRHQLAVAQRYQSRN